MRVLKLTQSVTVEVVGPADDDRAVGPLPESEIAILQWQAAGEARKEAEAGGHRVIEFRILKAEVVEV